MDKPEIRDRREGGDAEVIRIYAKQDGDMVSTVKRVMRLAQVGKVAILAGLRHTGSADRNCLTG